MRNQVIEVEPRTVWVKCEVAVFVPVGTDCDEMTDAEVTDWAKDEVRSALAHMTSKRFDGDYEILSAHCEPG